MITRQKFIGTTALAGAFSAEPFDFRSNGAGFNKPGVIAALKN
jgi:hypothetical protein